ncbi:MAG: NnrU family protein, partial [Rhizobiales bacterium]|nr:NnrU family protein [Hyphomicrobiales bacterium]
MLLLAFAVALFALTHLIPAMPALKQRLQSKLGA